MQDHIPDALINAFERQYDSSWNDPQLRNERLAMRYGWAAAMEAKQCLHQIQEPAPVTAMDALREAEAALEVAMARILKADPGHSICVTSEAKALVAVRAALAAPAPMLVAQPQLHAALFAARGALQHMKEGGKPTQSLLNEAIAAIDSVALTEAAPAAVAVPTKVIEALEMLENGALNVATNAKNRGDGYDEGYANAMAKMARETLDGLSTTTAAAAPVVLPEPVPTPCRSMFATQREYADAMAQHRKNWAEIEAERGMLATGGQAQADKEMQLAMQEASSLAQSIFKRHYSDDEHYASGSVVWGLCDSLRGVISQIDNMTSGLVRAPQAQAVGRGEVLVTVSGFTGSGKSAIAGEIEILCRALGLQVEWPDGESEKNMTHADWTAALEQYKPRVRIVEQNIPFVSKKGLSK